MHKTEKLFSQFNISQKLCLKNRIVMAPLIQRTACELGIPDSKMFDFYSLRADAGLIITEATMISESARSYSNMPGIYTESQCYFWKKIVEEIHGKNGKIFIQLWHPGRISHRHLLGGKQPLAPSKIKAEGKIPWSDLEFDEPMEMNESDINHVIHSYVTAAQNAVDTGFDGIEIHAANGYLLEQFLRDDANKRLDKYGGTPEKKTQFPLKVIEAVIKKIGYHRVGVRVSLEDVDSKSLRFNDVDVSTYASFLQQLNEYPLAYIHLSSNNDFIINPILKCRPSQFLKSHTKHPLIACGSYNPELAEKAINDAACDLVSFGRLFLKYSNLVDVVKNNHPEIKPKINWRDK
jgi:N-ethylmaleimide reductase